MRRRGLTIVELLVVLAIVGFLAAVLIPAVQHARESARRGQCVARLHQIGVALQLHESANRYFPPAMPSPAGTPGGPSGLWYSPSAQLLPYLERQPVANLFSLEQPVFPDLSHGINVAGGGIAVKPEEARLVDFLCPSDALNAKLGPGSNYRYCTGAAPYLGGEGSAHPAGGSFVPVWPLAASHFSDGLSNTIGVSEKRMGTGDGSQFDPSTDYWYTGIANLGIYLDSDQMLQECGSLAGAPSQFFAYPGATWFYAGFENSWYNHVLPPNSAIADCSRDWYSGGKRNPTTSGAFRATSSHPGTVNCLLMDGGVRTIADGIDITVWRAAATRAGGEEKDLW